MRSHPGAGHALLKQADGVGAMILDVCLHHHEKLDGSGYPYGLRGEQISLAARMGAVCDIYDAITSNRPYKAGWGPAESLRRMAEWRGSHLDPAVFSAFVQCVGIYPVGSLVRLASCRLAIVTELTPGKALTMPMVKVFFSLKTNTFITPALLDLSQGGNRDEIVGIEDAAAHQFKDLDRLWCAG
jgi:HD-GYP domain-containing protein (c-di-GMP phosphodiesterase class II)